MMRRPGVVCRISFGAIIFACITACSSSDRGTEPDRTATLDVGPAVDEIDRARALDARQAALERNLSGRSLRWENRARGVAGTVTPIRTYRTRDGIYCREFLETVRREAADSRVQRTACRDQDGVWRVAR